MSAQQDNKKKYELATQEYLQDANSTLTYLSKKYAFDRHCFARYLKKVGVTVRNGKGLYNKEFKDRLDLAVKHYANTDDSIEHSAQLYDINKRTLGVKLKELELTRNSFTKVGYNVDINFFECIDNADKAYWFGMLMADGNVRYIKNEQNLSGQVTLELSDIDYVHLEKFKEALHFSGPIHSRRRRKISSVTISRVKICNDLAAKGCVPNKTQNGWVNIEDLNGFYGDFLRGYCDGNGYIDKKRCRIILTMKAEGIKDGILLLTTKYGGHVLKENNFYRVNIENKEGFYLFLEEVYKNAKTYLNRKMATAMLRLQVRYGQQQSEDHRKKKAELSKNPVHGELEPKVSQMTKL